MKQAFDLVDADEKRSQNVWWFQLIFLPLQGRREVVSATKVTLIIHHLKHKIMNKTFKTILQVISYIISLLLGAAGGAMMN